MKFSEFLKMVKKENKLTQEAMGFEINCTTQQVHFWLNGKKSPKFDEAKRIADVFGYEIVFVKKAAAGNESEVNNER